MQRPSDLREIKRPFTFHFSPFDALDACSWRAVEMNGFSSMQAKSHANRLAGTASGGTIGG
jgi:hypothetical protein